MMIVLSYDVDTTDIEGAKRLRKVAKICESYGCRVQNSVFELLIDPTQLVTLKSKLSSIIDEKRDSIRLYRLGSNWKTRVETIGRVSAIDQEGVLIL